MRLRPLRGLVWPLALLAAAGVTGGLAEATAGDLRTLPLYGLLRATADLVLAVAVVWLAASLVRLARR